MKDTTSDFFDKVYALEDDAETQALYRDWAESYDADLTNGGYASPARCAEALAEFAQDRTVPVLDIGCGTGLSGEALRAAGFTAVDGTDVCPEMQKKAAQKGIYRALLPTGPNVLPDVAPGAYAHAVAVGVFSPGHAEATLIDAVIGMLPSGGLFVFTLNDHALADPAYIGRVREMADAGGAELLLRERGPHIPSLDLQSTVFALRKR